MYDVYVAFYSVCTRSKVCPKWVHVSTCTTLPFLRHYRKFHSSGHIVGTCHVLVDHYACLLWLAQVGTTVEHHPHPHPQPDVVIHHQPKATHTTPPPPPTMPQPRATHTTPPPPPPTTPQLPSVAELLRYHTTTTSVSVWVCQPHFISLFLSPPSLSPSAPSPHRTRRILTGFWRVWRYTSSPSPGKVCTCTCTYMCLHWTCTSTYVYERVCTAHTESVYCVLRLCTVMKWRAFCVWEWQSNKIIIMSSLIS